MKLNINIPATPKRTRILAAFMAFLIFALTFQEAFVGWGVRVKADSVTVTAQANQMIINEVTDFSAVNPGLAALTAKAAEDDVFKYTVSNNGAGASGNEVKTPTYDTTEINFL